MSLPATLTIACALLLGACGWDGPAAAVQVVPEGAAGRADHEDRDDHDDRPDASGTREQGGRDGGTVGNATATDGSASGVGPGSVLPEGEEWTSTGGSPADTGGDIVVVPPFPATVAVVGDSLTLSASEEITTELAGLGLDVLVVDGVESRRMTAGTRGRPSGLDAIATIREGLGAEPDLWVIALGTNDVGAQVDELRFRDDVRAALAGVGADAPVVWVDIWIRDRRDAVVAANGVIRDELADRAAPSGVVGWFAHGGGDGLVADDGVHLTVRGQSAFAVAIANRVRSIYHR